MSNQPRRKSDVESGARPLHPMMLESPELRWSFIRKVYSISCSPPSLSASSSSPFVLSPLSSPPRRPASVYIVLTMVPFITLCPLYCYRQKHPVNYLLLGIFTLSMSFVVGLSCAFTSIRRGQDFSFLGPFLFGSLLVLVVFGLIQFFFPLGKLFMMIYGCLGAIIFCGYIVYDTNNLIKRFSYNEYIWASISLYLDILILFLSLLGILDAAD